MKNGPKKVRFPIKKHPKKVRFPSEGLPSDEFPHY